MRTNDTDRGLLNDSFGSSGSPSSPNAQQAAPGTQSTPGTEPESSRGKASGFDRMRGPSHAASAGLIPPGTIVGDCIVGDGLAAGGCAAVYHATHRTSGQHVAVKVLHANLAVQPKMVERFFREVEVVNLLRHPNIVAIYELGLLSDKRPFYVMEYLEGGTLAQLLRTERRLSPSRALVVLRPVCAALEAAHAAGVVHRDVKASNIAFTANRETIKLLDFGIAKLLSPSTGYPALTSVGRPLGTPGIMAPEQLLGGPLDGRVDVYALGALLFRLLTGRVPFDSRSLAELTRKHLEEPAPRPSRILPVPPALDAIVLHCLEKRPEHRFPSVSAFLAALEAVVGDVEPASTRSASMLGVAIYVDLRVRGVEEEFDDALMADLGTVLDLAEQTLQEEGFILSQVTGNAVLGIWPVRQHVRELGDARRMALGVAVRLVQAIEHRPDADYRLHANVALHIDDVDVRASEGLEILGGMLLSTTRWAPEEDVVGVSATPAMLQGISGFENCVVIPERVSLS